MYVALYLVVTHTTHSTQFCKLHWFLKENDINVNWESKNWTIKKRLMSAKLELEIFMWIIIFLKKSCLF